MGRKKTITLEDFATLRRNFVQAKDFAGFWNSFFDDFVQNPDFMEMGQPVQSASIESLVHRVGERMFQQPVKARDFMLFFVPDAHLIHGMFAVEDCSGNILYFDEIDMGLMGVVHPGGQTDFARFTLAPPSQVRPNA